MGLRKVLLLIFILLIFLVSVGCSNTNIAWTEEKDVLEAEIKQLKEENFKLEQDKEHLNFQIKHFSELNMSINEIVQEQVYILGLSEKERMGYTILPIYNANINTLEREISYYIYLPTQSTLEEKINVLAEKLSKYSFKNLPIEVIGIETIDTKRVAVINLQDHAPELNTYSWINNYFQGTSGGSMTSRRLVETFLQREYKGQWVDGVKILYNNTTQESDHIEGLLTTHYRD